VVLARRAFTVVKFGERYVSNAARSTAACAQLVACLPGLMASARDLADLSTGSDERSESRRVRLGEKNRLPPARTLDPIFTAARRKISQHGNAPRAGLAAKVFSNSTPSHRGTITMSEDHERGLGRMTASSDSLPFPAVLPHSSLNACCQVLAQRRLILDERMPHPGTWRSRITRFKHRRTRRDTFAHLSAEPGIAMDFVGSLFFFRSAPSHPS